tara:strand:- start:22881 stop:23102 length:222 start_codon:yes stop_codon:yes gene_type:complete
MIDSDVFDTGKRVTAVSSGLLKLQRPVYGRDGTVIGYDSDTKGIEEISIEWDNPMKIRINFDDGVEWIFERTN